MCLKSSFRSMFTAALLALLPAGSGSLQSAASPPVPVVPRIGFGLSHDQALRPLYGLPANLIFGKAISPGATEAAFSDTAGLVRIGSQVFLQSIDPGSEATLTVLGTLTLDESAPVLGISPSTDNTGAGLSGHAAVWLPSQNAVAMWTGQQFTVTLVDPLPGRVVSLLPTGTVSAALMVQAAAGGVQNVVVNLATGQVLSNTLVDAHATSAYSQNGLTLLATSEGLILVSANGLRHTIAGIPATVTFAPVSNQWVQIQSLGRPQAWAVYLDSNALAAHTLVASEIPLPRMQRLRRVPI